MSTRRDLPQSPYLAAVAGRKPSRVPVWFMRQAGRSLPEYRALRRQHSMLAACFEPEVACEVTMQPIRRYHVDAAILFSDIVVPLRAAGVDLDIVADVGPVIAAPVRTVADVDAIKPIDSQSIAPVLDAVELLVAELGDTPLIGFAGAPFTLASYLVEGGPSRHHARTKAMMLAEPATWHALMTKLTDLTIEFLLGQIRAGVDAIQVFDSWAGMLSLADYRQYALPHSARVFATLAEHGVPMTHFGVGTAELLGAMSEAVKPGTAKVVGVDWRTALADAAARVQPGTALQGNLDPVVLLAGWPAVERAARAVVDDGRRAVDAGAAGYVFNLGHGVLPQTDPGVLTDLVSLVHSL
ncbi:uroporphyrinogen decarboxylase [Mycobacterium ulcerans]|uniref:Uroporphyrinogen decarboxylase n=3 Tax=Mycobacterium ulcerans TaxID=1809 RepID=DCUP_MYCUA|nr:uroporphyrinogen decarboxylase [Mycobacterium ulcerans]A0PT34.1 RecName: Full=Uroporphyrinogen decarboxylase; Short=UPD; Short=URO-D [Mycobacterium ulcerans Agy99]EUA88276.1 uroporphyrinogen decarboxylase [Mycobacterium ulcerans str. Harvey]ABL05503.1 uroporphyrinogen decarboxylase HemE [Mycobacterium ulcerans Agy99]MEB3906066.1 uroporphyrinogen decarboxylase [Mycobacterium ulcerans]MEB3910222.1 uroporphyrinogen decarboxylase [Mycobacterium ulcerans]MEB3920471.1 uroporphyrinogen decarboxyl